MGGVLAVTLRVVLALDGGASHAEDAGGAVPPPDTTCPRFEQGSYLRPRDLLAQQAQLAELLPERTPAFITAWRFEGVSGSPGRIAPGIARTVVSTVGIVEANVRSLDRLEAVLARATALGFAPEHHQPLPPRPGAAMLFRGSDQTDFSVLADDDEVLLHVSTRARHGNPVAHQAAWATSARTLFPPALVNQLEAGLTAFRLACVRGERRAWLSARLPTSDWEQLSRWALAHGFKRVQRRQDPTYVRGEETRGGLTLEGEEKTGPTGSDVDVRLSLGTTLTTSIEGLKQGDQAKPNAPRPGQQP